jgi:8-oxo-dGTP pyrophosphatase MutT (NUDIX family)
MRTGAEVAVFVTRRNATEVLIVHRSPEQSGYRHVIAGGVESGESARAAAERELHEESGLVAEVSDRVEVVEYAYPLTQEPVERRELHNPTLLEVQVTCFRVDAPDGWEPVLDWEHDDYRWCDPQTAFGSLRWPETAQALLTLVPSSSAD